jgi:cell division protein FtsL
MMRIFNICVIAALLVAAADVYKIKFESTREVERLAKLRNEIRREQDAIAALRAEWSRLDSPARIEHLARRHLALKPVDAHQYDRLESLPARAPDLIPVDERDPIGTLIADPHLARGAATGSIPVPGKR